MQHKHWQLLKKQYSIIQRLEDDERIEELWDIPKYLTKEEAEEIGNVLNKQYWNNTDNIIKKTFEVYPDLMPSIEIPAETTVSESPY